jgi:glycosyltransferase involved in cell wall biosynthesis
VIYLSKEWAKQGHAVNVYNRCGAQEGVHDGVEYIPFTKFEQQKQYDVLIIWREAGIGMLDVPLKANRIILELHDIPVRESRFTESRLKQIDRIFVKSRFHKDGITKNPRFRFIPRSKFVIIPNGINIHQLPADQARDPYSLIYASNYPRGLEYMLKYGWPLIKKEIPRARLDVYYGWQHYDYFSGNEKRRAWKAMMIDLMKDSGVVDHGRVGCEELLRIKARTSIHYYGSIWPETDCISIWESAAVGCVPVTTAYGPLGEKGYCLSVKGDPREAKTQEALAHKIIALFNDPRRVEKLRRRFRKSAQKNSWRVVAGEWSKSFI